MHLNRFRFGLLLAAACVAVAVLVVAFAGSGGDANLVSGSSVAEAAGATARVPGASVSMQSTIKVDGVPKPIHVQLSGVQDLHGHSASLAGYYLDLPQSVPGRLPDGRVPISSVYVPPSLFMKSPLFAKGLPDGKEWIGENTAKVGEKIGIGDPSQFGQNDPMQFLSYLRATSSSVTRVGSERVRGVATTHYRGTVQLRQVPNTQPPAKRAAMKKSIDRLISLTGTDAYPVEVWIDDHHMVRRLRLTMKMKIPQANRGMTMDMTIELFDFGRKQAAKPPPADRVYDITAQAAKAGAATP